MVCVKISCRKLVSPDKVPGTLPSAFVVVYSHVPGNADWTEVTRTETITQSCDPDFRRMFEMEYKFELYQQLRVVVFNRDSPSENLQAHSLIGASDCTLGSIVACEHTALQNPLINRTLGVPNDIAGFIHLAADEISSARNSVTMQFAISALMTDEQREAQREYFDKRRGVSTGATTAGRITAAKQQAKKLLPTRSAAAALFSKRRGGKDAAAVDDAAPNTAAVPAHQANQYAAQVREDEAQRAAAQAAADQAALDERGRPPPFVPFVTIMRAPRDASAALDLQSEDIDWEEKYKSAVIEDYEEKDGWVTLPPFTLSEYDITEGDPKRLIRIAVVCKAADDTEQSYIIGELRTTFPSLRAACAAGQAEGAPPTQLSIKPMGMVYVLSFTERREKSFIEYLKSGCDFGLMTAIDFTSSNGDPRMPSSRHAFAPNGSTASPNEYEAAMTTVANMLSSYSSDFRIPAYGFGAIVAQGMPVSHCFPVKGPDGSHFCKGVAGLIEAYKLTLGVISLNGPTMFSEVLKNTFNIVLRRYQVAERAGTKKLAYTVLLILTDGVISDYDLTLQELIKLSHLPISVVIIGIGNQDFGKMNSFDFSNGPLRRGRTVAKRPFVQFVPYNAFRGDLSKLAEKVLGNIPDQVMSYYHSSGRGSPSQGTQSPHQPSNYVQHYNQH